MTWLGIDELAARCGLGLIQAQLLVEHLVLRGVIVGLEDPERGPIYRLVTAPDVDADQAELDAFNFDDD